MVDEKSSLIQVLNKDGFDIKWKIQIQRISLLLLLFISFAVL
jgi:hypothetical protein